MGSEAVLFALVREGKPVWALLLVATAGNTLGSVINYALGRWLLHFQDRRWFVFKADQLDRVTQTFNRYGRWSLLFAWLPVVGDPLTFVAGVLRVPFWPFLALVAVGKAARYGLVICASNYSVNWF
ncbi:DedA family protein [Limnobacter humi]|uniref:DedA family protein n=1 Tax=Limnobacter humi TaxID=1778671 RepID=A0ABT1WH30_9BURK|nr:YqaA family protein [Limnobacter humi]MCQ8896699.1 DedA family protein [Limnobacter humi]